MKIKVYDPKAWLPFLFTFHQENIFRRLRPIVLVMIIYATLVSFFEYFLQDYYSDLIDNFSYLGQFHLLFNFVLSILIAFRVNTAYSRWWEGRGLWGILTNASRNLAMRFEAYLGLNNYIQFKECLQRFPDILKHHLRCEHTQVALILAKLNIQVQESDHMPYLVLNTLQGILAKCRQTEKLSMEQFLMLNENLAILTDVLGGCEKILNTPVPVPFNVLIKQALFFYMMIFPFGWAGTFGFFVIPMIIVMIYVLCGLEALADELEDPFNYDDNDLPLDTICATIAANVNTAAATGIQQN